MGSFATKRTGFSCCTTSTEEQWAPFVSLDYIWGFMGTFASETVWHHLQRRRRFLCLQQFLGQLACRACVRCVDICPDLTGEGLVHRCASHHDLYPVA